MSCWFFRERVYINDCWLMYIYYWDYIIILSYKSFLPFFSEINECLPSPCQHSSKCLDLINKYKCHCSDGFTGTNCEKGMNKKYNVEQYTQIIVYSIN